MDNKIANDKVFFENLKKRENIDLEEIHSRISIKCMV